MIDAHPQEPRDAVTSLGAVAVTPRPRSRKAVVVGVDGSDRNRAAVTWAVHEAEATDRPLTLLSVLDDYDIPVPHRSGGRDDDMDWTGLHQLATDISLDRPELPVHAEMAADGTVRSLLARSADQGLLVVGKRGLGTFARALIGSTSIAVAGRSRVPVVIVPDTWDQAQHSQASVLVGVDPDDLHTEALTYAFKEARRRGVRLVVVHGWEEGATLLRDPAAVSVDIAYWKTHGQERLAQAVAPFRKEFHAVRVELLHRHEHPATALLDSTGTAQLLVLGRHDDGRLGGFPFGSVTRGVLHHSVVPVAVVPSTGA